MEEYANKEVMENVHQNIYHELGDVKGDLKEIKQNSREILIQTTRTNGRVSFLENILWKFLIPVSVALSVYTLTTVL